MALWTPGSISTALWLDFADNATVFNAETGGSLSSNGGPVGRIEDKSGNARHFNQNTAAQQPTYVAPPNVSLQNNKNYTTWDGGLATSGDRLAGLPAAYSTLNAVSAISIFAVCRIPSSTSTRRLIAFNTTGSTTEIRYSLYTANNRYAVNARRLDGDTLVTLSAPNVYSTSWNIVESLVDLSLPVGSTNALQLFANGLLLANAALPSTSSSSVTTGTDSINVRLGSLNLTQWFNGSIGEVLMLTSLPTLETRQTIQGYLAHKWGLAGNLDASHPYKLYAPAIQTRRRRSNFKGISL